MDAAQFDGLLRHLTTTRSRRAAVVGLVSGALGLVGLAQSQAKGKGGKGKGKGKKKKPKKITCTQIAGICSGSLCGLGDACCAYIDCDCRQNLYCNVVDSSSEMGTCQCITGEGLVNGRCGAKPDCIPAGQKREFGDKFCCSGSEVTDINDPANGTCLPGTLACLSDADCTGGSCRGYACYAPELDCNIY